MTKMTPPRGTRAVQPQQATPNFRPRRSGAIAAVGPVLPKRLPVNGPSGVRYRKSVYEGK